MALVRTLLKLARLSRGAGWPAPVCGKRSGVMLEMGESRSVSYRSRSMDF